MSGPTTHPWVLGVVAVGGALGAATRWEVGRLLPTPPGGFPWGTFWVDVSGAFAIGVLAVLVAGVAASRYLRPLVGVGFLGGFTTFSTYALDTRGLLVDGHAGLAATYLFGTLAAGLVATWTALVLTRRVVEVVRRDGRRR